MVKIYCCGQKFRSQVDPDLQQVATTFRNTESTPVGSTGPLKHEAHLFHVVMQALASEACSVEKKWEAFRFAFRGSTILEASLLS